ncbi:MAG: CoA transferase [Acidobacteriota bacterium]
MKLDGIRVLDLSLFLPGPTVTQMMADHGADVVKIESVGAGEPTRHIGHRRDGRSVYFDCTQRGKRSVTLNLKDPRGLDLFRRLAATADVVLESFRPGVAKRLGVDYCAVREVRPDVVYASISAFGQSGPLEQNPAHDLAVEAFAGLLSCNADDRGNPVIPAMPAADMLVASMTLSGIAMALFRRAQTGQGDYLDMAMMDSVFASMPNSMGAAFAEKRAPEPRCERIWGGAAMYRIYETSDDKHVVLGGSELKFAKNLLEHFERLDLLDRLEAPPGPEQWPVMEVFEEIFRTKTQEEWVQELGSLDLCFAPVNDLRTGLDLEQTRHREMVVEDEQGHEHLGIPMKFRDEPGEIRFASPDLGEHTEELLEELGVPAEEVEALRVDGVV